MGTKARVNRPASLAVAELVTPLASFVVSTLALGIALPLGSVTVPVTVAVFTWPTTALQTARKTALPNASANPTF